METVLTRELLVIKLHKKYYVIDKRLTNPSSKIKED